MSDAAVKETGQEAGTHTPVAANKTSSTIAL